MSYVMCNLCFNDFNNLHFTTNSWNALTMFVNYWTVGCWTDSTLIAVGLFNSSVLNRLPDPGAVNSRMHTCPEKIMRTPCGTTHDSMCLDLWFETLIGLCVCVWIVVLVNWTRREVVIVEMVIVELVQSQLQTSRDWRNYLLTHQGTILTTYSWRTYPKAPPPPTFRQRAAALAPRSGWAIYTHVYNS